MSTLNNIWTRLVMAGLIAAGLSREAAAQDGIPTLTPNIDIIEDTNNATSIIDNIENNILLHARTHARLQKHLDNPTRKTHENILFASMQALQRALSDFSAEPLGGTTYPDAAVTGTLDRATARALIAIGRDIRFYDIFFSPPLDKYDADTLTGLSTVRENLKKLAPDEYMTALQSIASEMDSLRELAEDRVQVGLVMEFKHCALAFQDEIPNRTQLSHEIEKVSSEDGYVSQYVSENCYIYTKELTMATLRAAQLDFLHQSPVTPADRAVWCHRDGMDFNGPKCLEHNL